MLSNFLEMWLCFSVYVSEFFFSVICFLQVYTDGRPNISAHGRKATVKDFYGTFLPTKSLFCSLVCEINSLMAYAKTVVVLVQLKLYIYP